MKLFILIICFSIAATFAACSKTTSFDSVNTESGGLALKGFDAVGYFAENKAIQGNHSFEYVWKGAKWLFANEENMEKFKQTPETYAPQFGGFCSYAVSKGYTADGDPNAWKIVDNKLYLNYSPQVKELWEKDEGENIEKAKDNWIEFGSKKPEHNG